MAVVLLWWLYCCYWVSSVVAIRNVLENREAMEKRMLVRPLELVLIRNTRVIRLESTVFDIHLCYFLLRRGLSRNNRLQLPNDLTRVDLVLD